MNFTEPQIEKYAIGHCTQPGSLCEALETHTRSIEQMSQMLIGKLEASFLGQLIRIMNAKRILEIGTFTGYSALAMAENLPEDGELHTIDIQKKECTNSFWQQSPHGKKIKDYLGKGLDVIPTIPGKFDLVFIDADKENYSNYFDLVENRLNTKGLIVVDNVLWSGNVLKTEAELAGDSSSLAIKLFNQKIQARTDLYKTMVPIRDGIFLISKMVYP